MRLTIGMATFDDYDGVWATTEALRLYHDVDEIVVVDNDPDSPAGKLTRDHCRKSGIVYEAMATPVGTAAPRNRVFELATGDFVVCVDSHVLLNSGSIARLREWIAANPESRDLIAGPLIYEERMCVESHALLDAEVIARILEWIDTNIDGNDAALERRDIFEVPIDYGCRTRANSRVLLNSERVFRMREWIAGNNSDEISVPLIYESRTWSTHFDDRWIGGMRGTWGLAFACPCGEVYSTRLNTTTDTVRYLTLMGQEFREVCPCGNALPDLPWPEHDRKLPTLGYRTLGAPDDAPFEIPAMGLGLFGCRKDAWLGFNGKFRGFGGEEWYIHEKFRRAGAKCLCLPFLRWSHRFGRAAPAPYPSDHRNRCRNYVIGHAELGKPLDVIREHFVDGGTVTFADWMTLQANPLDPPEFALPARRKQICEATGVEVTRDVQTKVERIERVETEITCSTGQQLADALVQHGAKADRLVVYGFNLWGKVGANGDFGMETALSNFLHHEPRWTVTERVDIGPGMVVLDKSAGPGTQLQRLLATLGITAQPGCDCLAKANEMDAKGVVWCREHRDEIVQFLRDGQTKFGWGAKLGAGWRALTTGLVWATGITDPIGGLVDEAIRRSERAA